VQLQRAEKMNLIGALAGGVAHDLNNILSGVVSYPDLMLLDLPADSPLREPLAAIKRSGVMAAAIVKDLLTLARRALAVTEVVNINQVVTDYLKSPEFERLSRFHPGSRLELDLREDLWNVSGSPVHLSKTVMNLVSNAYEAMPKGGAVLVKTENRSIDRPIGNFEKVKEGNYVVITISDTGIGISRSDLMRIFEPFYTKKVMGRSGTGLGMAVVWSTIKDHKGYIDVESMVGKGTTFTLYIPVTQEAPACHQQSIPMESYMGRGESVLIVDDVELQRELAVSALTKLGYAATAVSSGEEACEYLKKNSAELIILDMIMAPGMDGLETYRRIIELHPGQKAIIASGYSESHRVKRVQELGAGQYLRKPYTLKELGPAVRQELDKGPREAA
jgi:two-component system cell cycle sensor histidine kinase/response regulator CckA